MIEIHDIDYNNYINIIGTAHFTKRSINDVYHAIKSSSPEDVALELDIKRFKVLSTPCITCPQRNSCMGICEFTGAAEALGNVDANIWLIDMTELEIMQRIRSKISPIEMPYTGFLIHYPKKNPIRLWEMGYKDEVVNHYKRRINRLRRFSPSVWNVLIDERNSLMASRLAWIISNNINRGKNSKILAFVGAAHVEGIINLLENPLLIRDSLRRFSLSFSNPTLIRRVAVTSG
jgi:pheromone shutdown protein TraB